MNEQQYTDLDQIKERCIHFVWGRILGIHEIGPYGVVEHADRYNGKLTGKTLFHIYVNGMDARQSFTSLDTALIGAVAYRNLGNNASSQVAFITRGLGLETP